MGRFQRNCGWIIAAIAFAGALAPAVSQVDVPAEPGSSSEPSSLDFLYRMQELRLQRQIELQRSELERRRLERSEQGSKIERERVERERIERERLERERVERERIARQEP